MFGMRDVLNVQDVGCSGWVMFAMCNVRDAGYSGCRLCEVVCLPECSMFKIPLSKACLFLYKVSTCVMLGLKYNI